MNVVGLVGVAWLLLGLETGLRPALALGTSGGPGVIAPSFVIPLAVYVAMLAPARAALWACVLLGLALDLTSVVPMASGGPPATLVGPRALGLLALGQFVLAARAIVIRRNPLSLVALSVGGALVAGVVSVALITLRGLYDPIAFRPGSELAAHAGSAVYTGVAALLMSWPMFRLSGFLGLGPHAGRRPR